MTEAAPIVTVRFAADAFAYVRRVVGEGPHDVVAPAVAALSSAVEQDGTVAVTVSLDVLNDAVNVIARKPYIEVAGLIAGIGKQVDDQITPTAGEIEG